MKPRTAFITGATSGIGRAGAAQLASKGYDLILTARSQAKAQDTERNIRSSAPDANINWLFGDFAKLSDVRRIGEEFMALGRSVDLLWLNAGLCYNKRILTEDGFETMWAVNHLAPFLLTQTIFEKLIEGECETRIVVTASGAHKAVSRLNLDDVNYDESFKTFTAYGNSKLANILFTQELARRLDAAAPNKTFTVNSFHPGFVGTGIGTQVWYGKLIMALCKPFVRSPEKGAETGLFLANDLSITGSSGNYYVDCEIEELKPYARDTKAAQALWDASMNMVRA